MVLVGGVDSEVLARGERLARAFGERGRAERSERLSRGVVEGSRGVSKSNIPSPSGSVSYTAERRGKKVYEGSYEPVSVSEVGGRVVVEKRGLLRNEGGGGYQQKPYVMERLVFDSSGRVVEREVYSTYESNGRDRAYLSLRESEGESRRISRDSGGRKTGDVKTDLLSGTVRSERFSDVSPKDRESALVAAGLSKEEVARLSPGQQRAALGETGTTNVPVPRGVLQKVQDQFGRGDVSEVTDSSGNVFGGQASEGLFLGVRSVSDQEQAVREQIKRLEATRKEPGVYGSVLVREGSRREQTARELFEELGAPKRELLFSQEFVRESDPTVVQMLLRKDAGRELSQERKDFVVSYNVPNVESARFAGFPTTDESGKPVSFPAVFSGYESEFRDVERRGFLERNAPALSRVVESGKSALEGLDVKGRELSSRADVSEGGFVERAVVPLGRVVRGVQEVGSSIEKSGGAVAGFGERLQSSVVATRTSGQGPASGALVGTVGRGLEFVGGFAEGEGRLLQERPVTAGAGEALLVGAGFGGAGKGFKILRGAGYVEDAAGVLVARPGVLATGARVVGTAGVATEVGAGVVLGGAFAYQTVKDVLAQDSIRAGGEVLALPVTELVGFGVGAKAGSGLVSKGVGVVGEVRSSLVMREVSKRLEGQLVPQAGEYVKVGERPLEGAREAADALRFEAGRQELRLDRLRKEEGVLQAEIGRRVKFSEDVLAAESGPSPKVEVLQLPVGESSGFLKRFVSEADASLALEVAARNLRLRGAREVPGSLRSSERSVFRNKEKLLNLQREKLPEVQRQILEAEAKRGEALSEAKRIETSPDAFEPVFKFEFKDRELATITKDVGVELLGREIKRDVYELKLMDRPGSREAELRGRREFGDESLVRPEDFVKPADTFLAKAEVETRSRVTEGSTKQGKELARQFEIVDKSERSALMSAADIIRLEPRGAEVGILRTEVSSLPAGGQKLMAGRATITYEPIELSASRELVLKPVRETTKAGGVSASQIGFEAKRLEGGGRGELEKVVRFQDEPGKVEGLVVGDVFGAQKGRARMMGNVKTGEIKVTEFTEFRKFARGSSGIAGRESVRVERVTPEEAGKLLDLLVPKKKLGPVQITKVRKTKKASSGEGGVLSDTVEVDAGGGLVYLKRRAVKTAEAKTKQKEETRQEEVSLVGVESASSPVPEPSGSSQSFGDAMRGNSVFPLGSEGVSRFSSLSAAIQSQSAANSLRAKPASKLAASLKSSQTSIQLQDQARGQTQSIAEEQGVFEGQLRSGSKLGQGLVTGSGELARQLGKTKLDLLREPGTPKTPKLLQPPDEPPTTPLAIPDLGLSRAKSEPGYFALVKRFGKFERVSNVPLSKSEALVRGLEKAAGGAGQTVRLVEARETVRASEGTTGRLGSLLSKFTKLDSSTYREKQKYLIDSPGELGEITFKGLAASKVPKWVRS